MNPEKRKQKTKENGDAEYEKNMRGIFKHQIAGTQKPPKTATAAAKLHVDESHWS